jgi:hypothetical protein
VTLRANRLKWVLSAFRRSTRRYVIRGIYDSSCWLGGIAGVGATHRSTRR